MKSNRQAELAALRGRHEQLKGEWKGVEERILALGQAEVPVPGEFLSAFDAACAPRPCPAHLISA